MACKLFNTLSLNKVGSLTINFVIFMIFNFCKMLLIILFKRICSSFVTEVVIIFHGRPDLTKVSE